MSDQDYQTQNENLVPTQLYDRELEEALIGAILINPDAFVDVSPKLDSKDFYIHKHEWIWDAFKSLLHADRNIDLLTVKQELESAGRFEDMDHGASFPDSSSSCRNNGSECVY